MSGEKNIKNNKRIKQYITFDLDEKQYGLDVMNVKSIERLSPITRVPKSENYVLGVINLRGDIIPVIDTRKKIGLSPKPHDEQTRIIIVKASDYSVGIIVDNVRRVLDVYEDDIQDRSEIFEGKKQEFIAGIIKIDSKVIMILDHSKILDAQDTI